MKWLLAVLCLSISLSACQEAGPSVTEQDVATIAPVQAPAVARTLPTTDRQFRLDLRYRAWQGDPSAQFTLGQGFENGWFGFRKILAEASRWYIKAAKQGHTEAQYKAGLMYEHGVGLIPKSMSEAYMWFTLAASNGIEAATTRRREIAKRMTTAQIAEGGRLAHEWKPKLE